MLLVFEIVESLQCILNRISSKKILFKKKLFKGEHWQIHKNISSSLLKQTLPCLHLKLQKKYWSLFNNNTFCKKNENFNRISAGYSTKLGTFHSISVKCVWFSFHFNFPFWNSAGQPFQLQHYLLTTSYFTFCLVQYSFTCYLLDRLYYASTCLKLPKTSDRGHFLLKGISIQTLNAMKTNRSKDI